MWSPEAGGSKSVGITIWTRPGATETEPELSIVSVRHLNPTQQPE